MNYVMYAVPQQLSKTVSHIQNSWNYFCMVCSNDYVKLGFGNRLKLLAFILTEILCCLFLLEWNLYHIHVQRVNVLCGVIFNVQWYLVKRSAVFPNLKLPKQVCTY